MGALLVTRAMDVPRGFLLLRLQEMSLSDNVDAKTEMPGELPRSLVVDVKDLSEDDVSISFADGSNVVVERHAYAEAI